jgi:hypothetical protein
MYGVDLPQFACNNFGYSEDGVIKITDLNAKEESDGEHPRMPGTLTMFDLGTPKKAFNTWLRWVSDYASRQLTKPSDKFAALAGITKYFQEATDDKPLAGLWEREILQYLTWYPNREPVSMYQAGRRGRHDVDEKLPHLSTSAVRLDGFSSFKSRQSQPLMMYIAIALCLA